MTTDVTKDEQANGKLKGLPAQPFTMPNTDQLFLPRTNPTKRQLWRIREVLFDTDMVATRTLLAIAELIWAINLLWPGASFERSTYAGMAYLADERIWGLAFLITAYIQWQIVVIGEFRSKAAKGFAFWNSMLWCYSSVSIYSSMYPPAAALSAELALAFASFWICIRPLLCRESTNARN